jgi:hypothetical protein
VSRANDPALMPGGPAIERIGQMSEVPLSP